MSSVETKIQLILNATDYLRLIELLRLFDEENQHWMLGLLYNCLEYPYHTDKWHIFDSEPNEYIAISEEIFDIVDGFICTANKSDSGRVWDVYGLKGINKR